MSNWIDKLLGREPKEAVKEYEVTESDIPMIVSPYPDESVEEFITYQAFDLLREAISTLESHIIREAMELVVADNRKKIEYDDMVLALKKNEIKVS